MQPVVFIHTNAKQWVGAVVSAYSLRKASRRPQDFQVRFIRAEEQPALWGRHGQSYLRKGKRLIWDNDDLQSFTPTRFLAPQLMGYQGQALVIDPDVFALADVTELLNRDMNGKAILCRQVAPGDGRPPYYATSVMLLDCARLEHWRWQEDVERLFSGKLDYHDWLNLYTERPEVIGPLEEEWNHFDTLNERTKLLHNTGRLTQPWKTGLPIDFTRHVAGAPQPVPQVSVRPGKLRSLLNRLLNRPNVKPAAPPVPLSSSNEVYQPHPDKNQEAFFFRLLKGCLDEGQITRAALLEEIKNRHIRPDALEIIRSLSTPVLKAG